MTQEPPAPRPRRRGPSLLRTLGYYWRTNLAVLVGAAVAAAVLTGALLVGDSVRGSLRDLTLQRLGEVDLALLSERAFRQELAAELGEELGAGAQIAPVLLLNGSTVHGDTRARASGVAILGVESGLAELYPGSPDLELARRPGLLLPPVILNRALADELGAAPGDGVVVSFEVPSDIPRETVVGRQEAADTLATLRLSVAGIVPDRGLGGFTPVPHQARPLNAFVDLERLQRALFGRAGGRRVNLLLADLQPGDPPPPPDRLEAALRRRLTLDDLGLRLRAERQPLVLESRSFVLREPAARAALELADQLGAAAQPVLTNLATSIRAGGRSIPYSTVTALEPSTAPGLGDLRWTRSEPAAPLADDEIALNRWAADELGAAVGDDVELDYYVLAAGDELSTASASLRLAGIVEMAGTALDRRLTPEFPGIHEAADIATWDPPFPVELERIRPEDEEYWDRYGATPKAFVSEALGRRLWRSRFGELTSVRLAAGPGIAADALARELRRRLPRALRLGEAGFAVRELRRDGLEAARGATDFAGLFLGLSMFLIASAALLVGLLFRLGVERRSREVGLLRAVGYAARKVRRRLLAEGGLLAAVGALAGLGGAVLYAWLMLAGLRTWWLPAVGTPVLFLHVQPASLAIGWAASLLVVLLTVWWTVRRLGRVPAPRLLSGSASLEERRAPGRRALFVAVGGALAAAGLLVAALATGQASSPGYAFGIGACLLIAGIAAFAHRCGRQGSASANALTGAVLVGMGARNTGRNRTRSILSVALMACASFLIVAVDAFRGREQVEVTERSSGTGGFTLVAESDVPLFQDLNRPERLRELGFTEGDAALLEGVRILPFRLLPGEDVSCLNLFRPERPRLLGVTPEMVARGGFSFQQLEEDVAQPWSLLERELEPGVVPAFGDFNSVMWILHSGLGQDVVIEDESGAELRLRLVGLLSKGIFQSELLISEANFVRHFPSRTGYSWFLADPAPEELERVSSLLEARLERFGFDATPTAERLAAFQAVENTYIATFQTLGGLGLLLGTVGLGIVLLRNVLERRAELAALRAFGYRRGILARMVLAENGVLLAAGIAIGAVAGLCAAAPHLLAAGDPVPWASLALTLAVVSAVGMASSALAVRGTLRTPLLPALKAE